MLSIVHRLPEAQRALPRGEWPLLLGRTLAGRRLGILGLGRHGTRVARIAQDALHMHVVAWGRSSGGTDDVTGIARVPLMKPGAILINTARGAIIDEPALIEALRSVRLSAAGLDVFATEPLPVDSPLRSLENVVLTPHIGWTVQEVFEEFAQIACAQLMEYRSGSLASPELLPLG